MRQSIAIECPYCRRKMTDRISTKHVSEYHHYCLSCTELFKVELVTVIIAKTSKITDTEKE